MYKLVVSLVEYFNSNAILTEAQSNFRKIHSGNTAQLKVVNDISTTYDKACPTIGCIGSEQSFRFGEF